MKDIIARRKRERDNECPMCDGDGFGPSWSGNCSACGGSGRRRPLTRMERLQAAADAGLDTWDDYRGEK